MNKAVQWLEEEFEVMWERYGERDFVVPYDENNPPYWQFRVWTESRDSVRGQAIFNIKDDLFWAEQMEVYYGTDPANDPIPVERESRRETTALE